MIHQNTNLSLCALVGAYYLSSTPHMHKGIHQMPDSESGPWESHPCRVLRQLRREVSLSPGPVIALSVAAGYFGMVSGSLPTLCPADTFSGRWILAYLLVARSSGNVSDECVLTCQCTGEGSLSRHSSKVPSLIGNGRDPNRTHFLKNFLFSYPPCSKALILLDFHQKIFCYHF